MEYIRMLLKLLREQLERLENYLDMNRSNFLRELVRCNMCPGIVLDGRSLLIIPKNKLSSNIKRRLKYDLP